MRAGHVNAAPVAVAVCAAFVAGALAAGAACASVSAPAVPLRLGTEQFLAVAFEHDPVISPLVLGGATLSGFGDRDSTRKAKAEARAKAKRAKQGRPEKPPRAQRPEGMALGPERARILLRSLTVPGWGQATLGRSKAAAVFATVDVGLWANFVSFRLQEQMRRESFRQTALLSAGIDLRNRDEEFRRIVGAFISSDEYNLYVVTRDAANIYLQDVYDPDMAGYRAYIERYSLRGADAWNWANEAAFDRYRGQRKNAHRAGIRANNMLGLAIANRIVSALHAARAAGQVRAPARTWRFELTPAPGDDATAFRAALRASF